MPQFDIIDFPTQIVWLTICFVALYFLMSRIALPRVEQVLEERQKRLDDNLSTAEQLNAEAKEEEARYETSLSDARARAREVIQEATADMSAEGTRRHDTLGERLAAEIKAAEARIAQAKDEAIAGIQEAASEVAASTVRHLIDESPSPRAVAAAVEAALREKA